MCQVIHRLDRGLYRAVSRRAIPGTFHVILALGRMRVDYGGPGINARAAVGRGADQSPLRVDESSAATYSSGLLSNVCLQSSEQK